MKVAVFGATGPTGQQLVLQALEKGYKVRALVRDPEKMKSQVPQHENLKIQQVDLSKPEELLEPLAGVDAVLSSLGGRAGIWNPCTVYTDTIAPILTAMKQVGVSRLVCVTAWGTKDEAGLPFIISWVLKPLMLRNVLKNMGEMEDYLVQNAADINYTVVRPPGLNNQPDSGQELLTRAGGQYVDGGSHSLSRASLARFMLLCLLNDTTHKQMLAVTSPK